MTRDLRLDVDGSSGDAQKALDEAAVAVDVLRKQADKLGDEFRQAARDATELDAKLLETKAAAAALAKEFAKTNDAGIKKELETQRSAVSELQRLRQDIVGDTERDASRSEAAWSKAADALERGTARVAKATEKAAAKAAEDAKKVLSPLEQLAQDAKKFSEEAAKAGTSLGSLFSGGLTSPAGLAALGALAPLLLGAAGGLTALAAAGAVAGAGIGGAIMGNPDVFQQEWSHAIGAVKTDWVNASKPFVGPTIDAIRTIGPLVDSWHIDTMFAKAAGYVGPLVQGAEGFVTGIEHGVDDLVGKAGPVVAVFSADLPKIGDAVGQAFSLIADNAEGGALALHDIDNAIADFVVGVGALISGAEAVVGGIHDVSNATKNWLDSVPGWVSIAILPFGAFKAAMDAVTPSTLKAAEGGDHFSHALTGVALTGAIAADQAKADAANYASLATQINATAVTADTLAASLESKVFNGLMSLDQATLHWHESLTKLSGAITKGKDATNLNSDAGQKNASVAYAAVSANQALYQANVAAHMSASDAAAAYSAGTAALEKQLRQAGLTGAQVDTLVGKYRGIPAKINTDIAMNGLTEAINRNTALIAQLNHIDGFQAYATVTIDENYKANRSSVYSSQVPKFNAQGSIRHAADGLVVPPSNPGTLIVGEPPTGGELWMPLQGVSQGRAQSLLQSAATGYGLNVAPRTRIPSGLFGGSGSGRPPVVNFSLASSASDFDRFMAGWFMKAQRVGTVQVTVN